MWYRKSSRRVSRQNANVKRARRTRRGGGERLEERRLLSISQFEPDTLNSDAIEVADPSLPVVGIGLVGPQGEKHPLSSLPVLNSRAGAAAQLFLDFNGDTTPNWGTYHPNTTPAYDQDDDTTTFTDAELTAINSIWARVAEKFSPFNINVTTVDPGNLNNLQTMKIVIGGDGSWYPDPAGGVAYQNSFNSLDAVTGDNVAFVFPKQLLNGDAKNTAEATSHEAGHTFGLAHQSVYNGGPNPSVEYNPGDSAKAPLMGDSYNSTRGLWSNGRSSDTNGPLQDDLAVVSSPTNAFGYRPDDHGNSTGTADPMSVAGNLRSATGVIAQVGDVDYFSFTTTQGLASFRVDPAPSGPMLDATLELRASNGDLISAADTTSLSEFFTTTLAPGSYFLAVRSHGSYGDVGQFALTAVLPRFAADALEPNDTAATATVLGSETEVTERNLSIHDEQDLDFFRIIAHDTGMLVIDARLSEADGPILVSFLDQNQNLIKSVQQSSGDAILIVPVIGQQPYFVTVQGIDGATARYDLEIENFATPTPTGVRLAPASDTGSSNSDNVTQDTLPTFLIQTGVFGFVDADQSNTIDAAELTVLSAVQAEAGLTPGIAVEVTLVNTSDTSQDPIVGFANPISLTQPTVYTFVPESPLPDGVYLVSAATRIFDGQTPPKTGRSGPSEPLVVTIDTEAPPPAAPDLLASSDSGTFNDDDVTNIIQPAFDGIAELRSKVSVFALADGALPSAARLVGQGVVGSELSDGVPDNGLGLWEVTIEPLTNGRYTIFTRFEDAAGVISPDSEPLEVVIDTVEPNTPLLDLLSDSGRNSVDDLTNTPRPTVTMRGNAALPGDVPNDPPNDVIFRLYVRPDGNLPVDEILIYDSFTDATLGGGLTTSASLQRTISLTPNTPAGTPLPDGTYNFKLEVEDRAGNISHDFLLPIIVDATSPPVSFGIPTNLTGLVADSDTGSPIDPNLASDLITSDTTPKFAGQAEANAIVRVFADLNNNGSLDPTDQLVGQATAIPLDGNQAEPVGYWEIQSTVDVNQIFATRDGLRRFFVTAIDPAGNETGIDGEEPPEGQILEIFIDTQGPRVGNVLITDHEDFDLFAPKPQTQGPTPLVNSLTIRVEDFPGRDLPDFNYSALIHQLAVIAGNYRLVGDQTGVVAITSVSVIDDPTADGDPATAQIILHFAKPLPDDRYTLTVSDNITDPAGNKLDGENNADKPDGAPNFPSGDGVSGGSFTTRFTVDSRPEIGIWSSSSAQIDINGNFLWDPTNADQTNRDLTLVFGNTSDYAFAGDFTDLAGNFEGFDKVGIYGRINGQWQWRVDTNNDGVIDLTVADPANINGFPIAGNFDNNAANGDEVGVFDGANFWLDTNHDYKVDTKIASNLRGHPIAGDFDGDGTDDLGTYRNDTGDFQFDLSGAGGLNGTVDGAIKFDFPGVMQRPVAADMDQDGIDDIGLRVAGDNFAGSQGVAEWYFLISNQTPIEEGDREDGVAAAAVFPGLAGTVNALNHPFSPAPLGNDLFARFGDELGVPLVGNFDPPLTSQAAPPKVDNTALGQANTLVKALYQDILGRPADSGGLNYFASKVVAGATSQVIANQLLTSPEYYGKLVDSFYATYLHRQADAGGRAAWVGQLSAGTTSDQIVASFLTSAEYASKNNGNAAFVDGLYRDILGRNADAGGRASWINLLNSGTSKKDVITGFLTSQERREKLVDQVYRQMLNHSADTAGKQLYSAKLLASDFTLLSLEAALAASDEYFTKVYGKS